MVDIFAVRRINKLCMPSIKRGRGGGYVHHLSVGRGKWGKADYLRSSMQYLFTECLYLTKDFSIV